MNETQPAYCVTIPVYNKWDLTKGRLASLREHAGAKAAAAPLLSALNNEPETGVAGPLLLYANDKVQHLGVVYRASGGTHLDRIVMSRRNDSFGVT